MTPTDVPDPNPNPTPAAAQWLRDLRGILADLNGGLAKRLTSLAESVPDSPAAFEAIRELTRFAKLPGPLPPARGVVEMAATIVGDAAKPTADAVGAILTAITHRADALLAAGANDPAGAIVRLSDFQRAYRLIDRPYDGLAVADIAVPLPPGHPAAGLIPHRLPSGRWRSDDFRTVAGVFLPGGTPILVLGRSPAKWFWLESVRANTQAFIDAAEAREREEARLEEQIAEDNRRQFAASHAGQAARLAELERRVAATAGQTTT